MTAQRIFLRTAPAAAALLAVIGFQGALSADTVTFTAGNAGSVTVWVPTAETPSVPQYQEASYEISPAGAASANAPQPGNADASAWQAVASHAHN